MYYAVSRESEKPYGCGQNTIYSELLGPVYTERLRQRYDDACDVVLFEKNGVAPKWVAAPFWSDSIYSIDFNKGYVTSVITALTLMLGVNGTLHNRMF